MRDAEIELRSLFRERLWDNDPYGMDGAREIARRWSRSDALGRSACAAALVKIALERDRAWATALRALSLIGADGELRDLFGRFEDFDWQKQVAMCLVATEDPASVELCLRFAKEELELGQGEALAVVFGLLKQASAQAIPVLADYVAGLSNREQAQLRSSMPGLVDSFLNQPDLLRSLMTNLNGQNAEASNYFSRLFHTELSAPWRVQRLTPSQISDLRDSLRLPNDDAG